MDIEVLSPAGGTEALFAAVKSGADAVYLGSTEFSARRNAKNFDKNELKSAVEYCHIRGVRVYLTLNISLKDSEINDALLVAEYALKVGVDGFIVEDLGLSYILKKRFPDIELHASTQMTVHEKSALPFLKSMGFSRVVVSREMSKSSLADFCKAAKELGIEVEVFVHGALCMCVSGQCLLSAVLGARSGNRGLCAGPCRLPFKAKGGTGYDLSLKDLCLIDNVKEMYDMGVSSLKIEGRMKRPEYVSAATYAVRQAVDNGFADSETLDILKDVFSRSGFTKGYFEEKLGRDMFGIRTKEDVTAANDAFSRIHAFYRNERQSVPIDIFCTVKAGKNTELTLTDGENTVTVEGEVPQSAQTRPTDEDTVKAALNKLGSTPYYAQNITVLSEDGLFVSASSLNALRREGTEALSEKRSTVKPFCKTDFEFTAKGSIHKNPEIFARFLHPKLIPDDLSDIDGVILPSEYDFPRLDENIIKITDTPRYITDGEALLCRLKELNAKGVSHALCGNLSGAVIAKKAGLEVIGDTGLNVYNSASAGVLEELGLTSVTVSAELNIKDAESLKTTLKKGIFAYGRLPLMLTRNCPLKNGRNCGECDKNGFLTDRMGVKFPVRCRKGYSELFNSKPIFLADKLNGFINFDYYILSFLDETPEQIKNIVAAYKNGGTSSDDFTRGLYFKGVL